MSPVSPRLPGGKPLGEARREAPLTEDALGQATHRPSPGAKKGPLGQSAVVGQARLREPGGLHGAHQCVSAPPQDT